MCAKFIVHLFYRYRSINKIFATSTTSVLTVEGRIWKSPRYFPSSVWIEVECLYFIINNVPPLSPDGKPRFHCWAHLTRRRSSGKRKKRSPRAKDWMQYWIKSIRRCNVICTSYQYINILKDQSNLIRLFNLLPDWLTDWLRATVHLSGWFLIKENGLSIF